MSNIPNKVKERIIKLYKLATQGVGGEQDNAKNILDKILAKHGIDLSEIIDDNQEKWFVINFKNKFEKRLITQIIAKVRNRQPTKGYVDKNRYNFKVSDVEFAEILIIYSVYKKALASEFEDIFIAFIHKQRIFPDSDYKKVSDDQCEEPKTIEEKIRLRKITSIMDSMDKVTVHKAIED